MMAGLGLSAALAAAAIGFGQFAWLVDHGFSALTLAIVLGMAVGNTVPARWLDWSSAGIDLARQRLLRLGVVLYGLRLTVHDISRVGVAGLVIDALVLLSTLGLAVWLGRRWLRLEPETALLIGAGSSICGAAAVMATEPVLRARADQVTVAVATVVVFGTVAIFLYPLLFELNRHWPLIPGDPERFGIYIGSTVHEVAQVVAAGRSIGPDTADAAVITKMVRVMMLAPVLLALSIWLQRRGPGSAAGPRRDITIPWFAFGFIGVVLLNSPGWLPGAWHAIAIDLDTALLATAMAALGLATRLGSIRRAGARPLLLALMLFGWLVGGGALINRSIGLALG